MIRNNFDAAVAHAFGTNLREQEADATLLPRMARSGTIATACEGSALGYREGAARATHARREILVTHRSDLFGASPEQIRVALRQIEPDAKDQSVFVRLEHGSPVHEVAVLRAEQARFPVIKEIHVPDEICRSDARTRQCSRRPLRRPN